MYAIVSIAGKQYKVEESKYYYTQKVNAEPGAEVEFDKVYLIDADSNVEIGIPTIIGAKVTGKILEHLQGDKVMVFKKKRRKGYRVKNGHRQLYSKILIEKISK